ncbi:Gfo/Idh/MocA family oxidoreductase [Crossiella sp. CA-258035]|uniref:Gfo/Idh/MocA family protein n=1 Tax=Crossiella sp. CA-258035 TaxID=2981138 RepID=UPI0024BCA7E0|nr:Gfo/Idh/MocA family oxidoreductase [Crossiella sp. CA-258035]WHT22853.1 Gfo/Idh/MocA family oxidoreductase [Crossiella sp. CA-258035]
MRIGVIGLGVISRFYLAALAEVDGVELAAVCDHDPETLAPHRGRVSCHTSHLDLIDRPGLDAVVVTVPNDAHVPVCRDALAAGLPVCVEKPLATTLADGRALAEQARAAGLPLYTAFHRRHNAAARALLDRLPALPPVVALRVRYLERIEDHVGRDRWYLDPERCGGGCVADNGPNAFDLVRQFLGPVQLTAADIRRDETGVDRQALLRLRSASGVPAEVELDWSYPGEVKDVSVTLADGQVRHADLLAGHSEFKGSLWHEYLGVVREFAGLVRTGGDPADGLAALALVDAAYQAELALPSGRES